ncbi:MAG: MFS transporter [Bdellovibrionota bacterium]|jgi:MFS family permease
MFSVKTFAALKHPNYRIWFWGQMISVFGYWVQASAQGFLVYELTGSPAFLGYVTFFGGLPAWILMLYSGVVADRYSRRKILIMAQSAMMLLALVLAFLTFSGTVKPWHIILLSFFTGMANAFDTPARHAFIAEIVPNEDLPNAIALNSVLFHTGTSLGPAVGGIIYSVWGAAWCFSINAVTFLAVLGALLSMKVTHKTKSVDKRNLREEVLEGIKYSVRHPQIRLLMAITMLISCFGISLFTILPAWAVDILHGDASTNGFLQTARGVGALAAALILANLATSKQRITLFFNSLIIFPCFLLLLSASTSLASSIALLFMVGLSSQFIFTLTNSFIQLYVQPDLRGRVMSIYLLTFFGFVPFGSLLIGWTTEIYGPAHAIAITAIIILLAALTAYPKRKEFA